jgi:hypothetical protein
MAKTWDRWHKSYPRPGSISAPRRRASLSDSPFCAALSFSAATRSAGSRNEVISVPMRRTYNGPARRVGTRASRSNAGYNCRALCAMAIHCAAFRSSATARSSPVQHASYRAATSGAMSL